ncbi:aldo/keto reductase [Pseudogulbenkiania sp. NH8B]|uniref:aldo/keto reductase n=1 Tax=Pseudogulbenkiania sp. (strain NH8B) TaxID=748280 RepID=UPI000227985F|nr:aldo/keto reductase [Pseudogulbenkiania sp. NH8B]BAK74953.1 aldo/keto reductase [Pseudogulbenkiania sp. NH8B]
MSVAVGTTTLAEHGPRLSALAVGAWRLDAWDFDDAALAAWIEHAIAQGLTTFDHADLYGGFTCEALFGRWLKANPARRSEIQLVSKCGIKPQDPARGWTVKHYDTGRAHILASVEQSLQNLGTDYLDLLLLHRPDPLLDPDEVADAFATLKAAGKVRHFGVSNFSPSQFALLASRTPLVTNQVEASLLHLAPLFDGSFDQCLERRVRPMIWSPLAGGRLFDASANPVLQRTLATLAEQLGVTPATLALAWLLRHPARPLPIVGSRRLSSLDDAARAAALPLERQHWFALLEAAQGRVVP